MTWNTHASCEITERSQTTPLMLNALRITSIDFREPFLTLIKPLKKKSRKKSRRSNRRRKHRGRIQAQAQGLVTAGRTTMDHVLHVQSSNAPLHHRARLLRAQCRHLARLLHAQQPLEASANLLKAKIFITPLLQAAQQYWPTTSIDR